MLQRPWGRRTSCQKTSRHREDARDRLTLPVRGLENHTEDVAHRLRLKRKLETYVNERLDQVY